MPVSLAALAFAATKGYYRQRAATITDPDPSLLRAVALVIPIVLAVTFTLVVSWATIMAYMRIYILLVACLVVAANVRN